MYKISKLAAGSVIPATAALGGASVALADGYASPRVAYERPADWSGVYFGVSSGWAFTDIHWQYVTPGTNNFNDPLRTLNPSTDSGIVGGHIGIQHQFGQIVLGVEANLLWSVRD